MTNPVEPPTPLAITFTGSSNILGARLDVQTGILEVDFRNGTTYSYPNVTEALVKDWQAAKSAGSWFDANIKKQADRYPATLIAKPPAAAAPAPPPAAAAPAPVAPAPGAAPELAVNCEAVDADLRALAHRMYEAYIKNSGGKAWDGRPCPAWDDLGNPVRSHWCAAAMEAPPSLTGQVQHLQLVARNAEQVAQGKLNADVAARTKMLDQEVETLRGQVAELERQLRAKAPPFAPWRNGKT